MNNNYLETKIENSNYTKLSTGELLLIAFFVYYYLLPSASNTIPFIVMLAIGCLYVGYFLFIGLIKQEIKSKIFTVLCCVVFVTLCYFFLTETKTIQVSSGNYDLKRLVSKFQQLFFTFLPLLFAYRLIKFGDKKQLQILLAFAIVLIIYVIIKTFNELSVNDTATRVWSEFSKMEAQNIGTYNFVYAISVSIPVVFSLSLNAERMTKRLGLLLYVVIGFIFLVMARYTLSLLISAILCYVAIFVSAKTKATKNIALILTPLILVLLPYILEFVALHIASGGMSTRLLEVSNFYSGEAMGYNLNGRLALYKETLSAFFDSPFIGNSSLEFDGHATFLTVLSDVGLVGAIPFYWLYFSPRKKINQMLNDKKQNNCFLLGFLAVVLTGLVNPIHAALPLPMVAWLVVPLAIRVFVKKDNSEN